MTARFDPHPRIRRGASADARGVAEVHCSSALAAYANIFPSDATKPTPHSLTPGWARLLDDPRTIVLVACADSSPQAISGVVALSPDPDGDADLLLSRLYVLPEHWGAGLGAGLHRAALDRARAAGARRLALWVLEANARARQMYENRGWRLVVGRTLANDPPTVLDVRYELDLD